MKKRILLISHNFSPEPTGIGKYNGDMFDWLLKHGYDCTVVTTYPYYPYWKVQPPYKNRWYKKEVLTDAASGGRLTVYRCPSYVPANPTGKKRMIQDFSYWTSMFWVVQKLIALKKKHDYIITVAPPFHLGYLAWYYKKIKGGKLIYHIQDLQIEAAQELNILSNPKLFNMLYSAERKILQGSDFVSSISDGMIKRIAAKAKRDVLFFPNWTDTSSFFPVENRNELKVKWGFEPKQFVCLYSGSIGEKQGLENIIYCADLLKGDAQIQFVICGTGPYKPKLEELVAAKGLNNVKFLPLQDRDVFNEFLNMADVHLVIQKGNAGDLVMPSKLTTILSVGGASVVTATPGTSLYEVVEKYDVGFIVKPDDYKALAGMIAEISKKDIAHQREQSRKYALEFLDIDNVMRVFLENISK
ncbi:glycosyltransferase WbuB [Mucilaginibacter sp. PPCGB 2223]|uniref:WcaI family glycosyltransferase n=1 Tax=Mucilaginibacter sp. PPCGB 2223 TaxID=1886027 RepID=UPI0008246663|nr:WcaI family glycosyltransferase [Mucilaginibacter sp. PPCGB 2223]OCX54540.1 glycosyltransferase WbuB [Mucilaginibacter sp. PPCGB 2223]